MEKEKEDILSALRGVMMERDPLKNGLMALVALLLIVNAVIFLDIPFVRAVLSYAFFSIVPGLLILYALGLTEIDLWRRAVLSYGLSISFMLLGGLLVNWVLPMVGIQSPLSTHPLVLSFDVMIGALCLLVYQRYKHEGTAPWTLDVGSLSADGLSPPLIFAFILPFIAIFGALLMNVTDNNVVLLLMPFLVSGYIALLILLGERVPKSTYPIAVLMAGLAITLILPLRGEYMLIGADAPQEYRFMAHTIAHGYWDMGLSTGDPTKAINACLSVSLLRPVIHFLTGIGAEWTYRLVTPLLLAIIPLALFVLFRDYIGEKYALLTSLFFISQYNFIYSINGARIHTGVFFLCLLAFALFDRDIDHLSRKLMVFVFAFSLVLTYYSFCYIFGILLVLSLLVLSLGTLLGGHSARWRSPITFSIAAFYFVSLFLWWSQITEAHFQALVIFTETTLRSMAHPFLTESHDVLAQKAVGMGLHGTVEILNFVIYYITLSLIFLGGLGLIRRYRTSSFGAGYVSMVVSCLICWGIVFASPYVAQDFGIERVYFPTIVFLSPMLVLGASTLFQMLSAISKHTLGLNPLPLGHGGLVVALVLAVIVAQFMVNMGITYQAFGEPRSVILNSEGLQYDLWYIHAEEKSAVEWLEGNMNEEFDVYGDAYAGYRFFASKVKYNGELFKNNRTIDKGYIFLRYQNVVDGTVYTWFKRKDWSTLKSIEDYSHILAGKHRIYDNGGAEIFIAE
ncbi:MAG: hypothetical protein PWR26_1239 [Methanosarcinales archaeon]|nr:hypothetical protein [Methanosarcinales archaeon]